MSKPNKPAAKRPVAKKAVAPVAPVAPVEPELHVVTEQDLIDNPEWAEQGIEVGDELDLSEDGDENNTDPNAVIPPEPPRAATPAQRTAPAKDNFSIITDGGEYIRTYADESLAIQFANKVPGRRIVPESSIEKITVEYDIFDEKNTRKAMSRTFTTADGNTWKDDAVSFKNEHRGSAFYRLAGSK